MSKPCNGYPSMTAALMALKSAGATTIAAADKLGVRRHVANQLIKMHLRNKELRVMQAEQGLITIPTHVIAAFYDEAQRRGCRPKELARAILTIVAEDDMFDAVLDEVRMAA